MRIGRAVLTAAMALSLTIGGGSAAWAGPGPSVSAQTPLPDGWQLTKTTSGYELAWRAPNPVPIGDAMVAFYAGDRLLGAPSATRDQRDFRLPIDGVAARNLTDLQVRAGGRRLDAPAEPRTSTAQPALAVAQLPPNPVDPGVAGPYSTISGEYTLPDVQLPGLTVPVEMRGLVVAPQGTTGQRPLVLFLHGRHATCYVNATAEPTLAWPCPAGSNSLPSYRGYQRAQQLLASQGYITVSISANSINVQGSSGLPPTDGGAQARSLLVHTHLGKWADWAGTGRPTAPDIVRSAPVADLTQVLLVGHSRGGEGVSRAALDSITPPPGLDGYPAMIRWQIRGLALISPTSYGHNPAPDVPSMVIQPACDGDVGDLEGQVNVDGTRGVSRGFALHSSVFVLHANHNYFNTEWTPGLSVAKSFDDYPSEHDPNCRSVAPTRLTPDQQQKVGATYLAAAAATFVAGNDQVRPLLDGSGFRAPSADPAIVLSHAIGGNRTPFLVPDASTVVSGAGGWVCAQVGPTPTDTCHSSKSPHFTVFEPVIPEAGRYAVQVDWSSPGTPVSIRPPAPVSIATAQALSLRVAIPAGLSTPTQFDVAITDTAGRRATLGTSTPETLPSPTWTAHDWAQEIRMPLTNATAAGLNLSQIATLELVPRSTSQFAQRLWLIDAWGWQPGLPAPQVVALPRVDLGELTVQEGNGGTVTYQVPAQVSGGGNGQVRVFVVDPVTNVATARVVTIAPGNTTISIPIQVTGNTQAGDGRTYFVGIKAVTGTMVGDAFGALTVRDDDA